MNTKIVTDVPQTTVLGSLLFLLALSDMPSTAWLAIVANSEDGTHVFAENTDSAHLQ